MKSVLLLPANLNEILHGFRTGKNKEYFSSPPDQNRENCRRCMSQFCKKIYMGFDRKQHVSICKNIGFHRVYSMNKMRTISIYYVQILRVETKESRSDIYESGLYSLSTIFVILCIITYFIPPFLFSL